MTEKATLAALKQRVPFRVARRILVAAGYPTGVSWGDIKQKLGDKNQTANTDPAKLLNLYRESLVATEKSVRAYNSPPAQNKALVAKLNTRLADDANHPLSEAFPYPIDQSKLTLTTAPAPVLVGKIALPDGDAFVLSYIRAIRYREQIPVASVKGLQNGNYQEVYGIKVDLRQAFEVIVIPSNNDKIYVLVDAPPGINDQVIISGHSSTEDFVKNVAGKQYLSEPFNLFRIIKPLYLTNDGKVLSVSHNAATSSTRSERMRGSKRCIKQEAFHEAGMIALSGNTDLYGVRKAWDMRTSPNNTVNVEFSIEGSYSLSYQVNAELYEGHVSKCASYREAQFVLHKLAALLDDI